MANNSTSTWTRIPPYLHRLSIPFLLVLAFLELHVTPSSNNITETYAPKLAIIFFSTAALCMIIERNTTAADHITTSDEEKPCAPESPSKLVFALSLIRATIYVFAADAAAAQLLLLHTGTIDYSSSSEDYAPMQLDAAQWIQLVLAGSMWLVGALLWVMEPVAYCVARSRARNEDYSGEFDEEARLKEGYFLLSQDDSDASGR